MPALILLVGLAAAPSAPSRLALADAVADGAPAAERAEVALVEAGRPGLWALAGALERRGAPEQRARLYRAAGAFLARDRERESALWLLRQGLEAGSARVRRGAVLGLARSRASEAGRLLLRRLGDPDPAVRVEVAAALAAHGAPLLDRVRALEGSQDPLVRETVVRVLARRRTGAAQAALLRDALRDPAANVRAAGIELAALARRPRHAAALRRIAHEGRPGEAVAAARALARLPSARVHMASLLGDPEAPLAAARVAFAHLRDARAHALDLLVPPLLELEPPRRRALAAPLAAEPRDEEIRDLVHLLSHPAPARARFARAWLRKIGGRADAVAARALLDARPARAAALRAYLKTRPGGGIGPRLLDAAREGPRELRVRSIAAIGALAPPPARARLVGLLDDPAPEIRAATAAATADLQAALPGLLILQGDPAREVRAAAVRALAHQPGADAWAARLHALSDEAESVRVAAIRGLAGSAHPEAIARLEQRVHAGSARERFEAVSALARSPSTAAAVKVVEMVAHRDPDVRRAALAYVETL